MYPKPLAHPLLHRELGTQHWLIEIYLCQALGIEHGIRNLAAAPVELTVYFLLRFPGDNWFLEYLKESAKASMEITSASLLSTAPAKPSDFGE